MPRKESFENFSKTCEEISHEKSKKRRAEIVANYLKSLSPETARIATRFLLGSALPHGRTINLGATTLFHAVSSLAAAPMEVLEEAFTASVDFGESIYKIMLSGAAKKPSSSFTLNEIEQDFLQLEAQVGKGSSERRMAILTNLLSKLNPLEAKWLAKIVVSEMRHGVNVGILIDALTLLTGEPRSDVETALMLLGEPEELAFGVLKHGAGFLGTIAPAVFRPLRPMLAEQAQNLDEAYAQMEGTLQAEIKLDGLRAQIHKKGCEVRIFSRSLRDLTLHPEEVATIAKENISAKEAILDAEVIAVDEKGSPLPFQRLSKRITADVLPLGFAREFEFRPYIFDILLFNGQPIYRLPLHERHRILRETLPGDLIVASLENPTICELRDFFKRAINQGHEGLMIKNIESPYRPGSRGKHWLKVKKKITLDLVIIAAEYGYGRRHGWLSNYMLAVLDERSRRFLPIGKTFKGLSDSEFEKMTMRLSFLKISEKGGMVVVKPEVVVEVSFGEVQRSKRYESGYALRFARIESIREDKKASEIDTLETLKRLYATQTTREI